MPRNSLPLAPAVAGQSAYKPSSSLSHQPILLSAIIQTSKYFLAANMFPTLLALRSNGITSSAFLLKHNAFNLRVFVEE